MAPRFDGKPPPAILERSVVRVPSLRNFNGSDFSVSLPLAAALSERLDEFKADIMHAHHPFLLGDTALRVAMNKNIPIIFTHHTRYEDYAHYVPFPAAMREVAIELPTHFANLCDGVIAPSESLARIIRGRGVTSPICASAGPRPRVRASRSSSVPISTSRPRSSSSDSSGSIGVSAWR